MMRHLLRLGSGPSGPLDAQEAIMRNRRTRSHRRRATLPLC